MSVLDWWSSLRDELGLETAAPSVESIPYGWKRTLPNCTYDAVLRIRRATTSARETFLQNRAKFLLDLHYQSQDYDTEPKSQITSPSVERINSSKQIGFLMNVTKAMSTRLPIQQREMVITKLENIMVHGIECSGDLSPGGFWQRLKESGASDFSIPTPKSSKKRHSLPPKFWSDNLEREDLVGQAEALCKKGVWRKVETPTDLTWVSIGFPVLQKGKLRLCVDYRGINDWIRAVEKIRLPGVRSQVELLSLCLSKDFNNVPAFFQNRRDLKFQIDCEQKIIKHFCLGDDDVSIDLVKKLCADLEGLFGQSIQSADCGKAFYPAIFAHDLKSYYYQFAVRDSSQNVVALALPNYGDGSDTWQCYESDCCVFGSLSSVQEACFGSEVHMHNLCYTCGLAVTKYIDDTYSAEKFLLSKRSAALLELYYALGNWALSNDKTDSTWNIQRCVVSLGVKLTISPDYRYFLSIPQHKTDKCSEDLLSCITKSREKSLIFKDLERVRGLFRHVACFTKTLSAYVKALDSWTEANFEARFSNNAHRAQLSAIFAWLEDSLKLVYTREIIGSLSQGHFYGDAALDNHQQLSALLAAGGREVSQFNIIIAGVYVPPEGPPRSFSVQIHFLPSWVSSFNIQAGEALAVLLGCIHFNPLFASHLTIIHGDNMADVWSLLKGASGNLETSAIIAKIHQVSACWHTYFAWVSTHRNMADWPTRLQKFGLLRKVFGPLLCHRDLLEKDIPWEEIKLVYQKLRSFGIKPKNL
jgi:hypothetical protein